MLHIFEKPSFSIKNPSTLIVFQSKNLVFWCITHLSIKKLNFSNQKTKFFNRYIENPSFSENLAFRLKNLFFWSSDHIFITNLNITISGATTGQSQYLSHIFIAGLRSLYNLTSLINDSSRGKGFRAFLSSCVGRTYSATTAKTKRETLYKLKR